MSVTTYNTLEWEMRKREERGEVRTVSSQLGSLSDEALSLLHDSLIDEHDAHREFKFTTGARVRPSLREYFAAVQLEIMLRDPRPRRPEPSKSRYQTKRPLNVLKRANEFAADKQGTCSLSDLQNAYKLRR